MDEIWETARLHQAIARLEIAKLKALRVLEQGPRAGIADERVRQEASLLLVELALAQKLAEAAAHDLGRAVSSITEWLQS